MTTNFEDFPVNFECIECDDFHLDSELNPDFLDYVDISASSSDDALDISAYSSDDTWEIPLPPKNNNTFFQLSHLKRGSSRDSLGSVKSLDRNPKTTLTENIHYDDRIFNLSYLNDKGGFNGRLFADVPNDYEKQQLIAFGMKLQTSNFGARTLDKVAKRVFGKDYLKGSGMSNPQIRDHINLLEVKFYAIAIRHLVMQLKNSFAMSKNAFLKRFQSVFESFFHPTSDHPCHHPQRSYFDQLMNDDFELELLFRFLAPLLILVDHGCDHSFFRRRSGLLLALGEFLEYSDRQYTSGGGKTLATKLREACMDMITGNERSTRRRKIMTPGSSPVRKRQPQRRQRVKARRMLEDSDSDYESNEDSDESQYIPSFRGVPRVER
eukprot:gene15557-17440_t